MTTAAHSERDAVDVMGEIMDGFTEYVSRAERQARGNRKYRLSLLWVHGFAALLMGPAFALLGKEGMAGGSWYFLRQIPGMPYTLAVILTIGGFILTAGVIAGYRPAEAFGLVLLALFYLTIGIGFGLAVIGWFTGNLSATKPAPYAPILYMHMTIIMIVHVGTILRLMFKQVKVVTDNRD